MKKAPIKAWADRWKEADKVMTALKRAEFRRADVSAIFLSLTDASEAALIAYPPRTTSGLVEMQRLFRKLSKK